MEKTLSIKASRWPTELRKALYGSDVLRRLSEIQHPKPLPRCATCSKCNWTATATDLQGYCTVMSDVIWDDGCDPILHCDQAEAANYSMVKEMTGWLLSNTPTGRAIKEALKKGLPLPADAIPLDEVGDALLSMESRIDSTIAELQARGD